MYKNPQGAVLKTAILEIFGPKMTHFRHFLVWSRVEGAKKSTKMNKNDQTDKKLTKNICILPG